MLDWDAFVTALKDRPKGAVVIEYQPNDPETYSLASKLWMALGATQWQASEPKPAPPALYGLPPILNSGVTVEANDINGIHPTFTGKDTPVCALHDAVFASLGGARAGRDESLPDNVLRLLVGPKP